MTADDKAIRALTWLWRLAKGWLPQTLGVAATVFSVVWASYEDKIWTEGRWAFIVSAVLLVGALVAQFVVQRPTYMRLASRLREAEQQSTAKSQVLEQAMQVLLRRIAGYCEADENSDRVSVYYFHEDRFVMLARYSRHPVYSQPGRPEYPAGQGAIGDAWDRGSIAVDLPTTRARWEQRLVNHHGYSVAEAAALKMHCVGVAAIRIQVDHTSVGVLVFESTQRNRVGQTTIERANQSLLYAALGELVSVAARLTPRGEQLSAPASNIRRARPQWKEVRRNGDR